MNKKKRLFFDIETSPNIGFFWQSGYKLNVPYTNIIKERAIICICYKWADEDKVYSLHWDKNQNDKSMLEKFMVVANEAHELVGHNGDRFDLPWIRTRCLFHGIPCFPNYTTLDTLKHARSKFRFRGRGLIQLTGRDNYTRFAEALDMSIEDTVRYLETPNGAVASAGWFWDNNKLNQFCDKDDFITLTKRINGGTIGLEDRKHHYHLALQHLGAH